MTKENLVFSNKMADIYYNSNLKMLWAIYHGLVDYNLFKAIINTINEIAIQQGICGALTDVADLRGSYQKMLEYMEKIGAPLLIEHGFKYQAQIISDDLIMINLSEKVQEIMQSLGVDFQVFKDRNNGRKWLEEELVKSKK